MAITVSATKAVRTSDQFQGSYQNLYNITAALSFAAIAAGAEDTGDITAPGVALGDHVIAYGFSADAEENIFFYNVFVSAANTISVSATNVSGSSDTPAPGTIKIVVGRPKF